MSVGVYGMAQARDLKEPGVHHQEIGVVRFFSDGQAVSVSFLPVDTLDGPIRAGHRPKSGWVSSRTASAFPEAFLDETREKAVTGQPGQVHEGFYRICYEIEGKRTEGPLWYDGELLAAEPIDPP